MIHRCAAFVFGFAAVALAATGPIAQRMQELVDRKEIPGVVTLVATRDKVTHLAAAGAAGPAGAAKMRPDSIFWIASMSKPITAVAVMMMRDEGKLSLDDFAGKYIPVLAPLNVTIRQMLSHTSGMGEATRAEQDAARTLADLMPAFASKKPGFAPGTQWRYCQSGINTAARIVEIVSGQSFDKFVEARIFTPLGMKDTGFYLSVKQMPRYVTPVLLENGKLVKTGIDLLHGDAPTARTRYPAANGGLFSTAPDYGRFAQMLLGGGVWRGKRLITEASFKEMTSPQTGTLKAGFVPGSVWGIGVGIVNEPQGITAMLGKGTFGHGGAYGTQAWIDPVHGVALILMIQRAKLPNSDGSEMRQVFQEAALSQKAGARYKDSK